MKSGESKSSYLTALVPKIKSGGDGDVIPAQSADESGELLVETPRTCLGCGYELSQQRKLHCPECGLSLARSYADPTPWAKTFAVDSDAEITWQQQWMGFVATCKLVIGFDRRTAIKTSLLPTTPISRKFAFFASIGSMPLFGMLALLVGWNFLDQQSLHPAVFLAGVSFLAAILGGVLLLATIPLMEFLFRGNWKKAKHRFIPSSVHYSYPSIYVSLACASFILLVFQLFGVPFSVIMPFIVVASLVWPIWLWNGVSQSGRTNRFMLRLFSLGFCVIIISSVFSNLAALKSGPPPILTAQQKSRNVLQAMLSDGVKAVESVVKTVAQPPPPETTSYVLIIDAIVDEDDSAEKFLKKLCPDEDDRFLVMKGEEATLDNIRKTFDAFKEQIEEQDSLVLYINGHGQKEGNGYIKVDSGYISNQMLEDFLFDLKTPDRLLIIDSCYAGNFLRSLRDTDCAIVAATDRSNIAWATCMQPLWDAWSSPNSDNNNDGAVDIAEAMAHSIEDMTVKAEENRQKWIKKGVPWRYRRSILMNGYMSPQYDVFGQTDDKRFKVFYRR